MKTIPHLASRLIAGVGCLALAFAASVTAAGPAQAAGPINVYTETGALRGSYPTIQAGATAAQAGDTVVIAGGTYVEAIKPNSGTVNKHIAFTNAIGQQVIITGTGLATSPEALFNLSGRPYIDIRGTDVNGDEGLKFVNAPKFGIYGAGVTGITITDVEVSTTREGGIVMINGAGVQVRGSEVHHTNQAALPDATLANHEGVSVENVDTFTVADNWVHHCGEEGIVAKYGARFGSIRNNRAEANGGSAIYIDAAHDITVASNLTMGTTGVGKAGIGLSIEERAAVHSLDRVGLVNNIIVNNNGPGITFWREGNHDVPNDWKFNDVVIVNNTVHGNAGSAVDFMDPNLGSGNIIRNTILSGNGPATATTVAGFTMDHNLTTAAQYVNAAAGNYRLNDTSPARDAGSTALAPASDYAGQPRPAVPGDLIDIGAYERD